MSVVKNIIEKDRKISESSDNEADPHFEPIITLPEVEVTTNEENEEELLKLRAKLYRFDTSSIEGPEWKERGTGEVKILRHKENNSARVVMRRDKTLKVCANHFITPWMELKPSMGSEKAFVYTVPADFADEQAKVECLAIRFGAVEIAHQFKDKFYEARNIVSTMCKLYNDSHQCDSENDEDSSTNSEEELDEPNKNDDSSEITDKLLELNVSKENASEVLDK